MAPTTLAPRPAVRSLVGRICTVCDQAFATPLVSPAFDLHLLDHELSAEILPPTED